jgi:hypothetical protein
MTRPTGHRADGSLTVKSKIQYNNRQPAEESYKRSDGSSKEQERGVGVSFLYANEELRALF